MIRAITITSLLMGQVLFAQDFGLDQRGKDVFSKLHRTASINCSYKRDLTSDQYKYLPRIYTLSQNYNGHYANALYTIDGQLIEIEVAKTGLKGDFEIKSQGQTLSGVLNQNNYFSYLELNDDQKKLFNKLYLDRIDCALELAMEDNLVIQDTNLHVTMHPQYAYDINGRSIKAAQKLIDDLADQQQVVYLDDYVRKMQKINFVGFPENATYINHLNLADGRGNPRDGLAVTISEDVNLMVSPAGINRYTFTKPDHVITISGGNHNYCIVNNTLKLLHAFLDQKDSKTVTINYMLDATVVQKGSRLRPLVRGMNIPGNIFSKSHLLRDVFKYMSVGQRETYQKGFLDYLGILFKNRSSQFSKLTLIQDGVEELIAKHTMEFKGSGEGELTVYINYL